jgi:acetyltransferase
MGTLRELTPQMLVRLTQIDYDREMALIAVAADEGGRETEVGVVRYVTNPDGMSCEFAIVVADGWQRRGLGRRLLEHLIEIARARGLASMSGEIHMDNQPMLGLVADLGFALGEVPGDRSVRRVALDLARGRGGG